MEDVKVDMVLTDPPYNITQCEWDNIIPFNKMWKAVNGLTHPNTPILLFGINPFLANLITSNLSQFRYNLIWDKKQTSSPLHAKLRPQRSHEEIAVFYEAQPYYDPQMFTKNGELIEPKLVEEKKERVRPEKNKESVLKRRKRRKLHKSLVIGVDNHTKKINRNKGKKTYYSETHGNTYKRNRNWYDNGTRYPKSIITHVPLQTDECISSRRVHPTQKPVRLLEYLIKSYTKEGDTVLDFTMGSGSTGVACKNTNRDFIGIELNDDYFEIACERINQAGD